MKIVTGHASLAQTEINDGMFIQIKITRKWFTDHCMNVKRK